jgi:hypothetical protein
VLTLPRTALVGAAACALLATGALALSSPASAEDPNTPGPIEENYDYPNAEAIYAERGIRLKKGDGRILLVDCPANRTGLLVVESRIHPKPAGDFCFQIKGGKGFVTMELPAAYFIVGDGKNLLTAKVTTEGETSTVDVKKDGHTPIGESSDPQGREGALVELRVKQ